MQITSCTVKKDVWANCNCVLYVLIEENVLTTSGFIQNLGGQCFCSVHSVQIKGVVSSHLQLVFIEWFKWRQQVSMALVM